MARSSMSTYPVITSYSIHYTKLYEYGLDYYTAQMKKSEVSELFSDCEELLVENNTTRLKLTRLAVTSPLSETKARGVCADR